MSEGNGSCTKDVLAPLWLALLDQSEDGNTQGEIGAWHHGWGWANLSGLDQLWGPISKKKRMCGVMGRAQNQLSSAYSQRNLGSGPKLNKAFDWQGLNQYYVL